MRGKNWAWRRAVLVGGNAQRRDRTTYCTNRIMTLCPRMGKAPKAENLFKIKGRRTDFSLPKANNIL